MPVSMRSVNYALAKLLILENSPISARQRLELQAS